MTISDLASASTAAYGGQQMDGMSGSSPYVPATQTTTDPAIAQMRAELKQNSSDFKSLKTALQSNDLASATSAFATLSQDIQKASASNGGKSPFDPNSPIGKDFQAIGTALQSGDVSAAKQAFAAFRHDIKSAKFGNQTDTAASATTAPATARTSGTSSTLDVSA
jgi:hypothetical protein